MPYKIVVLILILANSLFAKVCMITNANATFYRSGGTKQTTTYNEPFAKIFEVKSKKNTRHEVAEDVWIDNSDIICNNENDENSILAQRVFVDTFWGKKETVLYRKVLITNNVGSKDSYTIEVITYDNPELSGEGLKKISLYEIYFLFDTKTVNGKEVYLLGLKQRASARKRNIMIGWVDAQHAIEWSTRTAIEVEKKGSKIYHTPRLKKSIYLAPKHTKHYEMRYPLIEKMEKNIFEINFMGSGYGGIVDSYSNVINQKVNNIIFLIDNTAGMQNYIDGVKNALDRFLRQPKSKNLKVAIATYRDYNDGNNAYKLWTKNSYSSSSFLSPVDATSVLSGIKARSLNDSKSYYRNQGLSEEEAIDKSRYEAVFNGIDKLLDEDSLHFEKGKFPTLIVLIGDHGNHPEENDKISKIADKLKRKNAILSGIRVHYESRFDKYSQTFSDQINKIVKIQNANGKLSQIDDRSLGHNVISTITETMNALSKTQELLESRECDGVGWCRNYLKTILDDEAYSNLGKVQQSSTGFIKGEKFGKVLMVSDYQLGGFIQGLRDIVRALEDNHKVKDKLKISLKYILETLTGDEINDEEKISDFLESRAGIPINTPLLKKSLDELIKTVEEDKTAIALMKTISEKRHKLSALKDERKITSMKWNENSMRWRVKFERDDNGNPIQYKQRFNISIPVKDRENNDEDDGEDKFLWVPLDYIP